jgi:ribosomal protein L7/L12
MNRDLSASELAAITGEIKRGNKIAAIKIYRDATGSDLKDSKEAIEAFMEVFEASPSAPTPLPSMVDSILESARELSPPEREAVLAALHRRNKIEAIKLYREANGLGLAESKSAVEEIERNLPPAGSSPTGHRPSAAESRTPMPNWDPFEEKKKSGCFGVLFAGFVVAALLLVRS